MPDEYTELTYEDGELSGSGNRRWTSEDTWTVAKWGLVFGTIGLGTAGIIYRKQIGNAVSRQITECFNPGLFEKPSFGSNDGFNVVHDTDYDQINSETTRNLLSEARDIVHEYVVSVCVHDQQAKGTFHPRPGMNYDNIPDPDVLQGNLFRKLDECMRQGATLEQCQEIYDGYNGPEQPFNDINPE